MESFFDTAHNIQGINHFIQNVDDSALNEPDKLILKNLKEILTFIKKDPDSWDRLCKFNIKHIGDSFISSIKTKMALTTNELSTLYVYAYRFLLEYELMMGENLKLNYGLEDIKTSIQQNLETFPHNFRSQFIYASYVMPANILREYIEDNDLINFTKFKQEKSDLIKLKAKWETEINNKEKDVNNIKSKLEEYKDGFNFVGLYQGFSNLAKDKKLEATILFWSLITMGLLIISPLVANAVYIYTETIIANNINENLLFLAAPTLSIEVILIYFFRIILINHKSAKTQLLQIELRKTLCQFIQSYSDYSSKIKTKDSTSLEKFENLIFSGILSESNNLPSTFDGLDQLGALIKNVKTK